LKHRKQEHLIKYQDDMSTLYEV